MLGLLIRWSTVRFRHAPDLPGSYVVLVKAESRCYSLIGIAVGTTNTAVSWSVRRYPAMNRAYLAGFLSGVAGGVMGAALLPYLSDSKSHGMMATAGAAQPQEVLSARRIQLVDNTGRTR